MWWIPLAAAGGSALLGMYQGRKQEEAQERSRQDQARINMYAPLFGQQVQAVPQGQDMSTIGAMQGALSGFQMGQQYNMDQKLSALYDAKLAEAGGGGAPNTAAPGASTPTPMANLYAPDDGNSKFRPYFDPYNIWRP